MKRVMFVCKKNSARSQMAEGFAKTHIPQVSNQQVVFLASSPQEAENVLAFLG